MLVGFLEIEANLEAQPPMWLLANLAWARDNWAMTLTGHIENGVVVLDEGMNLPEGTQVAVTPVVPLPKEPTSKARWVEFPLVRTGVPGSVDLTNQHLAEILEEEDIAKLKGTWNAPS
jgi:hypothetical protein